MTELLSSLITEEMRMALVVVAAMVAVLYVLSIIWVVRDAYQRGAKWILWGIVAIIPLVGLVAYCLLRPSMLQIDRDEQELEIAYKQRELQKYGNCATCGYPVEDSFIVCPSCHTQLKNQCGRCGKPLDPTWTICPYCATPTSGAADANRRRPARSAQERMAHNAGALDDNARTVAMDIPHDRQRRRRPSAE